MPQVPRQVPTSMLKTSYPKGEDSIVLTKIKGSCHEIDLFKAILHSASKEGDCSWYTLHAVHLPFKKLKFGQKTQHFKFLVLFLMGSSIVSSNARSSYWWGLLCLRQMKPCFCLSNTCQVTDEEKLVYIAYTK